jgi:hypothetical protein
MLTHEHQHGLKREFTATLPSDPSGSPCPLFNSPAGCTSQKKCPIGRKHGCSVRVGSGFCLSPHHSAMNHPYKEPKNDAKKKGKGKGKGKGGKGKGKGKAH